MGGGAIRGYEEAFATALCVDLEFFRKAKGFDDLGVALDLFGHLLVDWGSVALAPHEHGTVTFLPLPPLELGSTRRTGERGIGFIVVEQAHGSAFSEIVIGRQRTGRRRAVPKFLRVATSSLMLPPPRRRIRS